MAAITIDRTGITLTNDTGTPSSPVGDGTLLSAADRTAVLDNIDGLFNGTRSSTFTLATLLAVENFGTHTFSAGGTGGNIVSVRNSTAGTGNYGRVQVGNDIGAGVLTLTAYSSTHATIANYSVLDSTQTNGLILRTIGAAPLYLGTNSVSRVTIGATGAVTLAASTNMDCGFLAYNSADDTTVASGTTVDFDTEIYDEGGHFSGDTFTAPVTGRYLLSASVMIENVSGGALNSGARIVCSNHTSGFFIGYSNVANGTKEIFSGSVVVDMDASDTATVQYYSDTGSATVVGSSPSLRLTWFCGRRVL